MCLTLAASACSSGSDTTAPPAPDSSSPAAPDGDPATTSPTATSSDSPDDGSSPATDPGGEPDTAAPDPTALRQQMATLAAGLPDEPRAAARELVTIVRDGSDAEALAATAELARRAGLPVASVDGDVIGLPDDVAFSDIVLPAELLGNVTRSVRSGALYDVESVGNLLYHLDTVDGPLPWAQLAYAVANWGKETDAPAFIQSAAATVRALSGERGDVFSPALPAAEQGIDALQLMLIVAHAGGAPVPVTGPAVSGFARPSQVGAACADLQKALNPPTPDEVEKLRVAMMKWGWGKAIDGALDYHGKLAEMVGDADGLKLVRGTQRTLKAYDLTNKAASYLAILVVLLGTELDLSADQLTTHYKHAAGTTAEEVTATARVRFDSALAQKQLACYGLAGLSVPKNGPVSGINIRWSLGQDLRPGTSGELAASAHLRPTQASVPKFKLDKTDSAGVAQVVLKPPVEQQPGNGPELRASVQLTAHVEKGEFPFSLADLTAVLDLNVQAAVIGKTIDALKSIAVDELLPTARLTIGVRYHGVEPVIVKIENSVNLVMYEIPRVYADLVSCTGLEGPYRGTGGYSTVGIGDFGQWASAGFGALGLPTLPEQSPAQDNPLSVIVTANGQPNRFLIAQGDHAPFVEGEMIVHERAAQTDDLFGWVTFDVGDGRQGQPVGELELLLGGNSWPFSDLTGTVYRVANDPRCPDQRIEFDDN